MTVAAKARWRECLLAASFCVGASAQFAAAYGPTPGAGPHAGWVNDHHKSTAPRVENGKLTVQGDTRVYLVEDHRETEWDYHKYVRIDLQSFPLRFTLDLSNVPCGCLACVYLVKMKDPAFGQSQYCDMANNVAPGFNNEVCALTTHSLRIERAERKRVSWQMCTELDLLEANNYAMQTAIHTELGGTFGSGNCDENGCFARIGGPKSPEHLQKAFGPGGGHDINTLHPFDVTTQVDASGAMTIKLKQGDSEVTSFDRYMAGAPRCVCPTVRS